MNDLAKDRCEMVDLAGQFPERVRQMSAQWLAIEQQFREQAAKPPPG